jgi:hypothetical protein
MGFAFQKELTQHESTDLIQKTLEFFGHLIPSLKQKRLFFHSYASTKVKQVG